jgi:hypothetical protein
MPVWTAMRIARAAGRQVSFDPNLRLALWPLEQARSVITQALGLADIALPGLDDARQITGLDTPEDIVRAFHKMGPDIVALTLGEDGALLGHAGTITHIPGVRVTAVDATGAGDCFDGAFLTRLSKGDTPEAACHYAGRGLCAVCPGLRRRRPAAHCCRHGGGLSERLRDGGGAPSGHSVMLDPRVRRNSTKDHAHASPLQRIQTGFETRRHRLWLLAGAG